MSRVTLKLHGARIRAAAKHGRARGTEVAGEHLLQVSRTLVPLEEGTLERSGTVTPDRSDESATVSYDTPYAVVQHEDLTLRHDPGRTAKYLEGPLAEEHETLVALVGAEIRTELRLADR